MRNELSHHGVKGMKWGVRRKNNFTSVPIKSRPKQTSSKPTSSNKVKKKKSSAAAKRGKVVSAVSKTASLSIQTAARYKQNQHTMNTINSLMSGNFGNAAFSAYSASKYDRVGRYLNS